jgi:hypothetical protein
MKTVLLTLGAFSCIFFNLGAYFYYLEALLFIYFLFFNKIGALALFPKANPALYGRPLVNYI